MLQAMCLPPLRYGLCCLIKYRTSRMSQVSHPPRRPQAQPPCACRPSHVARRMSPVHPIAKAAGPAHARPMSPVPCRPSHVAHRMSPVACRKRTVRVIEGDIHLSA